MLTEISDEGISSFVHVLEQELPRSLFIINLIETCHKWKRKNDQLEISLLYTEGSMETGVFISVVKSGCRGILVSFYALDGYENDLEKALKYMSFEWKNISLQGVVEKHVPILEKLISEKCLKTHFFPLLMLCIPKEEALKLDVLCPEEIELAPLKEHHADEMYKIWITNECFTIDALIYSIRYNDEAAYGVFCKKSGDLLARCAKSYSGALMALQTVEKARNKGYAKLLLKYVAKKMAERGMMPFSYTAEFNRAARNTFRSAGYKEVCKMRNYQIHGPAIE